MSTVWNAGSSVLLSLVLALLAGATAAAPSRASPCEQGVRRIELKPQATDKVHEVCIGQEHSTVFSFVDADLAQESVSLEGAERFKRIEVGESTLKLVPSERLRPGERLRMTVRFKDGAAPMSATFWLVVQPARAEPLVEVYRSRRTVESLQQEVMDKALQLRQCQEENARLHAEEKGLGGLTSLLDSGLVDGEGVAARELFLPEARSPGNSLRAFGIHSYRSSKRVAVSVWLMAASDMPPWEVVGAGLVGPRGRTLRVLPPRQREPVRFGGDAQRILIEAEATAEEAQGTFTLKLWDAEGVRTVTLTGVEFP
jgi:uncharacterized protein (TIGR02268 family)